MERNSNGTFKPIHGMYKSRFYHIWEGMLARCYRESCNGFEYYGGRGIGVAPEWLKFTNFYKDMYKTYSEKLTLERKDVSKDYSNDNCCWISPQDQHKNKSSSVKLEIGGLILCIYEWRDLFELTNSIVYKRNERGEVGYHLIRPKGVKMLEGSDYGLKEIVEKLNIQGVCNEL